MYSSHNNQTLAGAQWQQQYSNQQNATIHQTAPPEYTPTNSNVTTLSYFQKQKKYVAQFNTLLGGYFLLVISGYHIGWGVFNLVFSTRQQPWAEHETQDVIIMVLISWYLGSIVGSLLSIFLLDRMGKKNIYFMMMVIYLISSILLISLPENLSTIIVARSLAGLGHGVVYSTILVHAGEIATSDNRATLVQNIHLAIVAGLFSLILLMSSFNSIFKYNPNDTIGIAGIILSVIACIFIIMYTLESPIYLIGKQQEIQALTNILKFNSETIVSVSIHNKLLELKTMLDGEKQMTQSIITDGNLKPLIAGILSRLFYTLVFNYPINYIRMVSVVLYFNESNYFWAPTVLLSFRIVSTFICNLTVENSLRKNLFNKSAVPCIFAVFVLAVAFTYRLKMDTYLLCVCFFIEIFTGFGVGTIPDIIASEAYPIKKKVVSIVVGQIFENLFNICLICFTINITLSFDYLYIYLYITGVLMTLFYIFISKVMPETRHTTLLQAQYIYRG